MSIKTNIYFILALLLATITTSTMFSQEQDKNNGSVENNRQKQGVSLLFNDKVQISYRHKLYNNWYANLGVILSHYYRDTEGRAATVYQDRDIQKKYTLGCKILLQYRIDVKNSFDILVGGGLKYSQTEERRERWADDSYYDIPDKFEKSFGVLVSFGLEFNLYKSLYLIGNYELSYNKYKIEEQRRAEYNGKSFEFNELSVGVLFYF